MLPSEIGQLTQLQTLNLTSNKLTALPPEIGQLIQLKTIDLRNNRLTALPPEIAQLTKLQALYLSFNQLTALPPEIAQLTKLQTLDLRENLTLGLPPEVLGYGQSRTNPSAILAYYSRLLEESASPLLEAKILILGQGAVGKTSLVKRLLHDDFDPHESKTEGIDIARWRIPGSEKNESIRVNIWDFGGQEIMHATHQFFLTKRSLYILVLDARKGEDDSKLFYWLRIIQSYGAESPILVVINKSETHRLDLNERRLRKDYPSIQAFFRTSCETGTGLADLKAAIGQEIRGLEHVYNRVPKTFLATKAELEARTEEKDFLEIEEYEDLCVKQGIEKQDDQGILLRFLHDLGSVLHFADPDSPFRLEETKILNPQWVTAGVYKILNNTHLAEKGGILTLGDVDKILTRKEGYPKRSRLFILGMMVRFELCFLYSDGSNRYLVPELLPHNEPDLSLEDDALRFEYHYEFLTEGILPRLIVRMHAHLTDPPVYWRSGVLLEIDGNRALVRGDLQANRVYVAVCDALAGRRRALAVIRSAFRAIHATIPGLVGEEMVPLPQEPQAKAVSYEYLLQLEEDGDADFRPQRARMRYRVRELLDGIEDLRQRAERRKGEVHFHVNGDYVAGNKSKDDYGIYGTAGSVGPGSVVKGNTFEQRYEEAAQDLDLSKLADELARLREELPKNATKPEHFRALADVMEAESGAISGDKARALESLSRLGKWTLDVATKIGVPVASKALQTILGL